MGLWNQFLPSYVLIFLPSFRRPMRVPFLWLASLRGDETARAKRRLFLASLSILLFASPDSVDG